MGLGGWRSIWFDASAGGAEWLCVKIVPDGMT